MTNEYEQNIIDDPVDEKQQQEQSSDSSKERKGMTRNELFAMLDKATQEATESPENYEAFLGTQSRLDRVSTSNALLIHKQMPDASRLMDYKGWEEKGEVLKKGVKSIVIINRREDKRDGKIRVFYDPKHVFDVSQTVRGRRTPAPSINYHPNKEFVALIDTVPIEVETVDNLGYTDSAALYKNDEGKLYVRKNVGDDVQLFQSTVLEVAFAELSAKSEVFDRSALTFDAVSIANMVCKKFGVPSERFTIAELPKEWRGMEPKDIRSELSKIRDVASEICSRIYGELNLQRGSKEHGKEARTSGDAR